MPDDAMVRTRLRKIADELRHVPSINASMLAQGIWQAPAGRFRADGGTSSPRHPTGAGLFHRKLIQQRDLAHSQSEAVTITPWICRTH